MSKVTFNMEILDPDKLLELDQYIESTPDPQGRIINVLHKAQNLFSYLPKELQLYVARKTDLPAAKINGIVSFYSFFSQEPSGKYAVSVCMGTACFVKGSEAILNAFRQELGLEPGQKVTEDRLFSLRDVRCIGACGLAPVVTVNDKIYGHVTESDVAGIIDEYRALESEAGEETQ